MGLLPVLPPHHLLRPTPLRRWGGEEGKRSGQVGNSAGRQAAATEGILTRQEGMGRCRTPVHKGTAQKKWREKAPKMLHEAWAPSHKLA